MPYCYSGTRPKTGEPAYIYVTRNAIEDSLGSGVLAWLLRGAIPDVSYPLPIADFCGSLPPDPGAFDVTWLENTSTWPLAQAWVLNWYKAYIWNTHCE